ncbi:MAG: transcription-repair coupling factor [Bacteroidales bacterium]|nr:transcription-repair coupling factor [Bacteroidales bacterium]
MILTELYQESTLIKLIDEKLQSAKVRLHVDGMTGSLPAVVIASLALRRPTVSQLVIAPSKEEAYYLQNDLEALLQGERLKVKGERYADATNDSDSHLSPSVMLFPTSYRKAYHYDPEQTENANILMRTEVVKALGGSEPVIVVSYPEALSEKVVAQRTFAAKTLRLSRGSKMDMWDLVEKLQELGFEREDFVVEPGQYAVRGGIVDVYSFGSDLPFRIEFFDDEVDSLRTYDTVSQLSVKQLDRIDIIPNFTGAGSTEECKGVMSSKVSLMEYLGSEDIVWTQSLMMAAEQMEKILADTRKEYEARLADKEHPIAGTLPKPEEISCPANEFLHKLLECKIVEYGNSHYFSQADNLKAQSEPQPAFNKQFDLLTANLADYAERGYRLIITVSNDSQEKRLRKILDDSDGKNFQFSIFNFQLSHGFVDHDEKVLCYTDHEIFDRYHKYTVKSLSATHEALTLKELFELKPGDYVTHIDYGVGRFSGLEKVTVDGKSQELIRLIYKNNDVLYISIHGLHKISRYVGREGEAPQMNRLGSNTWQVLKAKTKRQVKDIAKDLIALYAKRKASQGFAFGADCSLQEQMEASFQYEDTPDQLKATVAVKHDMEDRAPMDRLVCGDVGFGKTEVAIRAAFKACCDDKQVAVLVPSTVLAFQHYNTFSERLKGLPVRVDYLNRFRTTKEKNQIYKEVEEGKIDILIGTHAITNKNLKFKDLGLLIIDEEQKFGVSVKEKLKQMKVGVDCLTLTATPIPRTLQFSLMGARDLSVIQTPPPNRQPIETELSDFSEELIRDAIGFEMSRGGQTFFISNRVENLPEMAGLVQRLVPDARVAMAHGRMDGKEAEETLMSFLEGDIDVLVATSIVENGLDIPNANTMIINNAHQFGLSDLHQMRGRVGRSNRKAFCYMLIPSYLTLTPDAQKRLKAIEEFSTIGSGFNIAMRDLDIRGAGNILGAEQSGFISEIGYDMYHKILNEAIEELKESDFADLFAAEAEEKKEYVRECTIETDLEVLLPDDYVTSVSERLLLYKELNDLTTEEELAAYRSRLEDRFGPVPVATDELIRTITLRRIAKEFGIEKIVLKQDRMVLQLVSNQQSPFYQSDNFMKVITYIQAHPTETRLRETPEKLTVSISNIKSITQALATLKLMTA